MEAIDGNLLEWLCTQSPACAVKFSRFSKKVEFCEGLITCSSCMGGKNEPFQAILMALNVLTVDTMCTQNFWASFATNEHVCSEFLLF
jgi:hypothetical protein